MKSFGSRVSSKESTRRVTVSIPLLKSDISRTHYTRIKSSDLLISWQGFQAHDKVVIIVIEADNSGSHTKAETTTSGREARLQGFSPIRKSGHADRH